MGIKLQMARGLKKHLKRLNAPKHWMLDKLSGNFAPRPSAGPHKLRECLPLIIFLRNRLKYALNYSEVMKIMMMRKFELIYATQLDSWMSSPLRRLVSHSVCCM